MNFWYTNIVPSSGIRDSLEKLSFVFKNINTELVDTSSLNFLVFIWETQWTFPTTNNTHSDEFIELLKNLQKQNFYFIADYSGESHNRPDMLSLSFLNKLKLNGIDINRLIVANNNSNKINIQKVGYGNFVLNTIFFPNFFLSTYNYLKNYVGINNTIIPDKNFLCLNRRMYYTKYQIIEELFNRGLLNDTRFSWVDNKNTRNLLNKELIKDYTFDAYEPFSISNWDKFLLPSSFVATSAGKAPSGASAAAEVPAPVAVAAAAVPAAMDQVDATEPNAKKQLNASTESTLIDIKIQQLNARIIDFEESIKRNRLELIKSENELAINSGDKFAQYKKKNATDYISIKTKEIQELIARIKELTTKKDSIIATNGQQKYLKYKAKYLELKNNMKKN